jgi:N-terminal domain of anti-restriction factor ArdC
LEAGKSDALTNYLTAMSRFHNYSFGNVLEIARQMPTATRVAGFWTWKNLGRSVKAGQKGIRILAPSSAFAARRTRKPKRTSPNRTPALFSASAMPMSSKDYLVICGRDSTYSGDAPHTSRSPTVAGHIIAQLNCPVQRLIAGNGDCSSICNVPVSENDQE